MKETTPASSFKQFLRSFFLYGTIIVLLLIALSWWQTDRESLANVRIQQLQNQYPQIGQSPVVLRFITSSCNICAFENDNIERAEKWGAVNTVNIVVGEAQKQALTYLQKSKLNVDKSIIDSQGLLFRQFNGKAVPLTVFIGSNNQVHHLTLGYTSTIGLITRYWLSHFF